jgi:hypothetical protein
VEVLVKSSRMMGFAVGCAVVIFVVSLGVAWVLFGILESSATADLRQWKLGGAFAGFAFTALLLSSTTFQAFKEMRRDKEEEYLRRIAELQSKLVRGAPKPVGFTVDVDERHKLVFARPVDWRPRQGILYQYVSPPVSGDGLPANFNVVFESPHDLEANYGVAAADLIAGKPLTSDELENVYRMTIDGMTAVLPQVFPNFRRLGFSEEYVFVDGLKSVRYTHTYAYSAEGQPETMLTQVGVATFHPRLPGMFVFTFTDDSKDFLKSSEAFSQIISSIRFLE